MLKPSSQNRLLWLGENKTLKRKMKANKSIDDMLWFLAEVRL